MKIKIFLIIGILIIGLLAIGCKKAAAASQDASFLLLNNVAATGAGSAQSSAGNAAFRTWGCTAIITGSPTAVTVDLEGDVGGTGKYSQMTTTIFSAGELTAGFATRGADAQVARSVRGNVTALTGGTSPKVTLFCTGVN